MVEGSGVLSLKGSPVDDLRATMQGPFTALHIAEKQPHGLGDAVSQGISRLQQEVASGLCSPRRAAGELMDYLNAVGISRQLSMDSLVSSPAADEDGKRGTRVDSQVAEDLDEYIASRFTKMAGKQGWIVSLIPGETQKTRSRRMVALAFDALEAAAAQAPSSSLSASRASSAEQINREGTRGRRGFSPCENSGVCISLPCLSTTVPSAPRCQGKAVPSGDEDAARQCREPATPHVDTKSRGHSLRVPRREEHSGLQISRLEASRSANTASSTLGAAGASQGMSEALGEGDADRLKLRLKMAMSLSALEEAVESCANPPDRSLSRASHVWGAAEPRSESPGRQAVKDGIEAWGRAHSSEDSQVRSDKKDASHRAQLPPLPGEQVRSEMQFRRVEDAGSGTSDDALESWGEIRWGGSRAVKVEEWQEQEGARKSGLTFKSPSEFKETGGIEQDSLESLNVSKGQLAVGDFVESEGYRPNVLELLARSAALLA